MFLKLINIYSHKEFTVLKDSNAHTINYIRNGK